MAKKQHGKVVDPKGKFRNKTMIEKLHLGVASSEDDDNDGPEEVTFEDSKTVALKSMKEAIETARREKELLKEKRRKKQELFQEQKKRRLLPDDVLEEIDSAVSKRPKASETEAVEEGSGGEASSSGVEESGESDEDDQAKKDEKKRKKTRRSLKGKFSVTRVKEQPLARVQQQSARDFIQSRLYGSGTHRTTTSQLLSLENKKGPNKRPAVKFMNEQLGAEKREKAEKLMKRWMHKQKMETS